MFCAVPPNEKRSPGFGVFCSLFTLLASNVVFLLEKCLVNYVKLYIDSNLRKCKHSNRHYKTDGIHGNTCLPAFSTNTSHTPVKKKGVTSVLWRALSLRFNTSAITSSHHTSTSTCTAHTRKRHHKKRERKGTIIACVCVCVCGMAGSDWDFYERTIHTFPSLLQENLSPKFNLSRIDQSHRHKEEHENMPQFRSYKGSSSVEKWTKTRSLYYLLGIKTLLLLLTRS